MAAETIAAGAKVAGLLPKAWVLAKKVINGIDDKFQYEFGGALSKYCEVVIRKYCKARTFFIRDEPQFIGDFYVPSSIERAGGKHPAIGNLAALHKIGKAVVVVGNGGSGKTVFMRYLISDSINNNSGYPVFIELRNLNDIDKPDLEKEIISFMRDHGFPLGDDYAMKALGGGLLTILLDGFDEVAFNKRKGIEKAIKKLASKTECQIVVSSRPDMILEGWDGFSTVRIAPLTLAAACELIKKIKLNDNDVKNRFVTSLKSGLFASHRYFLSNPLLLSIMLITYGDSAEIPKRFATFYEQAYTALFQKHDALKSGFKRERHTDLDIYEFSKMFSAFSAITYDKRKFRFSQTDSIGYAEQALKISGVREIPAQGFLDDAKQAVCLLIDDGLDLAFVHRSFQEYFVAKFIDDAGESLQKSYMHKICSSKLDIDVDSVLKILYELSPLLVEDNYLIPGLSKLFGKLLDKKLTKSGWRSVFVKLLESIRMNEGGDVIFHIEDSYMASLVLFYRSNCSTTKLVISIVNTDYSVYLSPGGELKLSGISPRSKLWNVLAIESVFGMVYLEELRLACLNMIKLSKLRESAVREIFSLES